MSYVWLEVDIRGVLNDLSVERLGFVGGAVYVSLVKHFDLYTPVRDKSKAQLFINVGIFPTLDSPIQS